MYTIQLIQNTFQLKVGFLGVFGDFTAPQDCENSFSTPKSIVTDQNSTQNMRFVRQKNGFLIGSQVSELVCPFMQH